MATLGKQKKWPQLELAAYMNDSLKWRVEKEFCQGGHKKIHGVYDSLRSKRLRNGVFCEKEEFSAVWLHEG